MKAELKVVRSLKYWEDADIFELKVKKKIAEMVVAELDEFEDADLGIESNRELIAIVIYRELLDELDKKDERGL